MKEKLKQKKGKRNSMKKRCKDKRMGRKTCHKRERDSRRKSRAWARFWRILEDLKKILLKKLFFNFNKKLK